MSLIEKRHTKITIHYQVLCIIILTAVTKKEASLQVLEVNISHVRILLQPVEIKYKMETKLEKQGVALQQG